MALQSATTIQHKQELIQRLIEHQAEIRTLGVKRLGLFGSFVRNCPHAASDVDLLVEFEPNQKTYDHFIQLAFLLEAILGRRVELITPESLHPRLKPRILQEVEYIAFFA